MPDWGSRGLALDAKADHPYLRGTGKVVNGFSFPAPRKLEQIIKYALLERELPGEIKRIWETFHERRHDCVATTLTESEYNGLRSVGRKNPMMVFPVRKDEGQFYMVVAQMQDNHVIFTYLEHFKRNPETAEPYLAVTLFDDFLERKQLVLVRGDFSAHL
jgi:hypothetical protein